MVVMSSAGARRSVTMEEAHRDVLRWSTVIGAGALGVGTAAGGQAFRGHGSAQIVFGLVAVLLLTIAAVVLPRVLRTAETDYSVAFVGASAFTAGLGSNINMLGGAGWRCLRWASMASWDCGPACGARSPAGNLGSRIRRQGAEDDGIRHPWCRVGRRLAARRPETATAEQEQERPPVGQ